MLKKMNGGKVMNLKKSALILTVIFALAIFMAPVYAADQTAEVKAEKKTLTLDEKKVKVKAHIDKSFEHMKTAGVEQALKDFSDPKGKFVDGIYYIFVIDYDGKMLAHGANAKMIGKSFMDLKDSAGKAFFVDFINVAKSKEGEGWVEYMWPLPSTKQISKKTSLIKKFDDKNIIGCGFYNDFDE